MRSYRLIDQKRWGALLASLVLLLGALAPVVSRTLAANGQPGWVEVCTAMGLQWVPAGADAAAAPEQDSEDAIQLDHCPLCVLAADRFAPLAQAPVGLRLAEPERYVVAPYSTPVLAPRLAWSASPRGPPHRMGRALLS